MAVDHSVIVEAIQGRMRISFNYRSSDETESSLRVVEPWIYGIRNGKSCLYGYQVEGGKPGMKRFNMERVKKVSLTGDPIENHPAEFADVTKWDIVHAEWRPTSPAKKLVTA